MPSLATLAKNVFQFIMDGDHNYFVHINQEWTNSWFDSFMPFITDFHRSAPYVALLVLFMIYKKKTKIIPILIGCIFCVALSDITAARVIKPLVHRPRPEASEKTVRLLVPHQGSFGFPSNHAANVFTVATFLLCTYPLVGLAGLVLATVVAYSRVYVGVHYPLDVFCGALLGVFWAFFVFKIYIVIAEFADPIRNQPVEPKNWEKRTFEKKKKTWWFQKS